MTWRHVLYALSRAPLWIAFLLAAQAWAAPSTTPTRVLDQAQPAVTVTGQVDVWIDDKPNAQRQAAELARAPFTPHTAGQALDLAEQRVAWLRLRLALAPDTSGPWVLHVPSPYLDSVRVYQQGLQGPWTEQRAGDQIAHTTWSHLSLTPVFRLALTSQAEQVVYVRVENYARAGVPLELLTENAFNQHQSREALFLGALLGLLATMSGLSLLRYVQHRAHPDLGALAYALLVALTVAQINGVLNATLWQSHPTLAHLAGRVIAPLALGGSLLYLRELYALSVHYHRFDRFLGGMGLVSSVFAIGAVVLDPANSRQLESMIYVLATAAAISGALLSWRAGSSIWVWFVLATTPQALCMLWIAAEFLQLVAPVWEMRYWVASCMALSVPILAYALSHITHDRKEREQRTLHLDTQDALTGLLTYEVFKTHLDDALHRVKEQQEPVALVVVSLVNQAHIATHFGANISEQSELRAVVKLHRVLRDVDPASRIHPGKFALLLEGIKTRTQLTERMVQLVASGLTPLPGLQPPVVLQFHAACVLLHERPLELETAVDTLLEVLAGMSAGTRRPIRIVEALDTQPFSHSQRDAFQAKQSATPPSSA